MQNSDAVRREKAGVRLRPVEVAADQEEAWPRHDARHNKAVVARLDRAIQGEFNRSSQHFSKGGCDEEISAAVGWVCAGGLGIAASASRSPA